MPRRIPWACVAACTSPEIIAEFWASVARRGEHECWLWTGRMRGEYGGFHLPFGYIGAHRFSLGLKIGTAIDGLDTLHSCDTPLCCNPSHLRAGTHAENIADRIARGRSRGGRGPLPSRNYVCECGGSKSAAAGRCLVCEGIMPYTTKYPHLIKRAIEAL